MPQADSHHGHALADVIGLKAVLQPVFLVENGIGLTRYHSDFYVSSMVDSDRRSADWASLAKNGRYTVNLDMVGRGHKCAIDWIVFVGA